MRNPAQGGASDQLAGRSECSTPKQSEPQRDDPIGKLRPWEPESKLQLRRRLNNAAVIAAARATRATSPHARQQLWLANIAAAEWTFATATEEQLEDALKALNYSVLGANWYERIGAGL